MGCTGLFNVGVAVSTIISVAHDTTFAVSPGGLHGHSEVCSGDAECWAAGLCGGKPTALREDYLAIATISLVETLRRS